MRLNGGQNVLGFPGMGAMPDPGSEQETQWRNISMETLKLWTIRCFQLGASPLEVSMALQQARETYESDPFVETTEPRIHIVKGELESDICDLPTMDLEPPTEVAPTPSHEEVIDGIPELRTTGDLEPDLEITDIIEVPLPDSVG